MPIKPDIPEPEPPPSLGPYRIEKKIGGGGVGAVYRAYDERLQRAVALKRVRAQTPEGHRRLADEARAIAQISHPNIVQVF
ncbi:MAG: protein kinase, partial [Acidobacteriota bacterium]